MGSTRNSAALGWASNIRSWGGPKVVVVQCQAPSHVPPQRIYQAGWRWAGGNDGNAAVRGHAGKQRMRGGRRQVCTAHQGDCAISCIVDTGGKRKDGRASEMDSPPARGAHHTGQYRQRGSRDRALIKWQSEDQFWLRNWAAKQPKRKKMGKKSQQYVPEND